MPKDITKGVSNLSIHPGDTVHGFTDNQQQKGKKSYRREQWVYGYHFKNRQCRVIARKQGFPWKKRPLITLERVVDHISFVSGTRFRLRTISYGGGVATIIFFVESDGRKRLKNSLASPEGIDRVRKVLGLPRGTKPKWYNDYGCDEHNNAADSSDDEALPVSRARVPPPLKASEFIEIGACSQDSDSYMGSDSEFEDDSDESIADPEVDDAGEE